MAMDGGFWVATGGVILDKPVTRATCEMPPYPKAFASIAAANRLCFSFKWGRRARNLSWNWEVSVTHINILELGQVV